MEFRSCPACKASVLEDDVEECPFCGASMSGKPQASPPKKPAAAPPAAAGTRAKPTAAPANDPAKPAARPTGRPTPPPKPQPASETDDPFEVDTSALRHAIKLSPRPTKTRTLEVTCPMCETHGFMLPADAGKDVHCCNPECMVPVFKTQKPKAVAAQEEPKKDNRLVLLLGGLVTAVVAVVLVWFFVLNPKKPDDVVEDDTPDNVVPIEDLHLTPDNKIVRKVEAPPATVDEIRKSSLTAIVERARQRDKNRSPDYGTQLAAEAYADAGDITRAREQVNRLQSTAAHSSYMQVQPLAEIGWRQLEAGNTKDALQSATTALTRSRSAPKSIRKTLESSISLAALLVALDKPEQAQELVQRDQEWGARGTLTTLWRAAVDSKSFQIDQEARLPWHLAMPEPMRLSIVETLVAQQYYDQALAFATSGGDAAAQSACRAAWAGRLAQQDSAHAVERVTAALAGSKISPAAQCHSWAALATMAKIRKQDELAKKALENAVSAAAGIPASTPLDVPRMKAIHDSEGKAYVGLPNPVPAHTSALALLTLGAAHLQNNDQAAAWEAIQKAVVQTRGMAPSASSTQELLDACDKQESTVRSQLNDALGLGNNEQNLRTAFARYRRQCTKLHAESQRRLDLQVAMLRFAAESGLVNETWQWVQQQSQSSEPQAREPYSTTTLPGFLMALAQMAGQKELAGTIQGAFPDQPATVDPLDAVYVQAEAAVAAKQFSQASDIVEQAYRKELGKKQPDRMDEIALRICSQAQQAAAPDAMIPFIKNLYDIVLQEDAFLQLAGYTIQAGTSAQLWKVAHNSRDLEALEQASIYRGYIAGLPRVEKKAAPAVPPETAAPASK